MYRKKKNRRDDEIATKKTKRIKKKNNTDHFRQCFLQNTGRTVQVDGKKKRTKRKKENALLYHFKRKRRKEGKSDADERALLFIGVGYLANGYALHN